MQRPWEKSFSFKRFHGCVGRKKLFVLFSLMGGKQAHIPFVCSKTESPTKPPSSLAISSYLACSSVFFSRKRVLITICLQAEKSGKIESSDVHMCQKIIQNIRIWIDCKCCDTSKLQKHRTLRTTSLCKMQQLSHENSNA